MENTDLKQSKKRKIDLIVISDIHLGTFGCRANELVKYLKSVKPKHIILNGDIIDIWQFKKNYFPKSHLKVIRQLMRMLTQGVKIHYITGNHDEMLRKFVGFEMGDFKIVNSLVLDIDGNKTWIFHGDVFDVTMQYSKWLTKIGGAGYDILIKINSTVNFILMSLGRPKTSFSKKIKDGVKTAVKYVNSFEQTCAETAIRDGYNTVICGHIHQPEIKNISTPKGSVTYLNSGDWVENLTALEYYNQEWHIYQYSSILHNEDEQDVEDHQVTRSSNELFQDLLSEFKVGKQTN